MKISEHTLVHAKDGGNGYHGRCQHCGISLETDLGWSSWDGVKCIEREITYDGDIPEEIRSYAAFRGYRWDNKKHLYVKASFNQELNELTLDQMNEKMLIVNSWNDNLISKHQ